MSDQKRGKKRSKSYYIKCAGGGKKMRKTNTISAGMKGFLVTCNKYERETVREMYNLLNEYADIMYGPELDNAATKQADNSDSGSEEEDIEKAMAKETSAIKQASTSERRFQNTDTRCNNVVFIRTTVDDPCTLAHEIFQDIHDKQVQKARYAIRMLPVTAICTPVTKEIEQTLRTVLAPHFETEFGVGINYTAACKIRNNNSVSKNMFLPVLGRIIKEMNPLHRLCHDEPDLVIIVEVIQKACCFSVVKDYFKFRKYNLHEIVKQPTADETYGVESKEKDVEDDQIDIEKNRENEEAIGGNIEITGDDAKVTESCKDEMTGDDDKITGDNVDIYYKGDHADTTDGVNNEIIRDNAKNTDGGDDIITTEDYDEIRRDTVNLIEDDVEDNRKINANMAKVSPAEETKTLVDTDQAVDTEIDKATVETSEK